MRSCAALFLLLFVASLIAAEAATPAANVVASGKADGNVPAWTITATAPPGWTADCCTYARAIGVNEVVYQGEWSGEPNRVMVLNVWPAKLASLDDELAADVKRYRQRDPAGRFARLDVQQPYMSCAANVFEGSDRLDDIVVFCDPGKGSGIRLSWSMTLAAADARRRPLLDAFMRVVAATAYAQGDAPAHAASPR